MGMDRKNHRFDSKSPPGVSTTLVFLLVDLARSIAAPQNTFRLIPTLNAVGGWPKQGTDQPHDGEMRARSRPLCRRP